MVKITGARCNVTNLILWALLASMIADTSTGLPRPDLANLRGSSGGFRGTKSAGWGLKLDTLPLKDIQEKKISFHRAVDYILSQDNSPSLRLALNDKLFLHHLKLLVDQPSRKHYNQLQNRFLTLRNRRTDEVSSRFFLRD
eukprot:TRINITY_DN25757_c0_g1_i1.p1 TRINITY_DN25757_c0_g1~~TRINITY_DN25757_c0_g1_i1.p1  ORF type:complete len:141 (+),score=39.04 TRINITY_DN25757_c0_g1_i1:136-558(+)